jgi:hypothetical protein
MKVNISKYPKIGPQRSNITIDKFDTWSLDHTLAKIILPCLIQLKHTKHGIPSNLTPNQHVDAGSRQQSFDFYSEDDALVYESDEKLWDEMLDKMIWSFQQLVEDNYDNKYHHGKSDYDFVKTDQKFHNPITNKLEETYKMVDKNSSSHWYDYVGHRLHEERIQEGLELFGKHFRNLWD